MSNTQEHIQSTAVAKDLSQTNSVTRAQNAIARPAQSVTVATHAGSTVANTNRGGDSSTKRGSGAPHSVSSVFGGLGELYQELLVEASRASHHRGRLEKAENVLDISLLNPLCGDSVELWIELIENRIRELKFSGQGCMISQAAASLICDRIKGADVESVRCTLAAFRNLIEGPKESVTSDTIAELSHEPSNELGDLNVLAGVRRFPARTRCALLFCEALERLLSSQAES